MTDNDELPGLEAEAPGSTSEAVSRAFGVANRERLLDEYFGTTSHLNAANAWQHVYRLLLWIDRTTGLAHCYESDKCQPGRPWYARSLRFHDWFASELESPQANSAIISTGYSAAPVLTWRRHRLLPSTVRAPLSNVHPMRTEDSPSRVKTLSWWPLFLRFSHSG